jgi:hypothetical protein
VNGTRPVGFLDDFRPIYDGMDEHGTSAHRDGSNVALGDAILMMGIDTTVADGLLLMKAGGTKRFCTKDTIVGVVAFYGSVVGHAMLLEMKLCMDGLLSTSGDVRMEEKVSARMINEQSACMVFYCSGRALEGRDVTRSAALELIAGNTVSWI